MSLATLKTRRLRLRPARLPDAPHFFQQGRLEEVSRPAGFPRQRSLAQTRTWLKERIREADKGEWPKRILSLTLADGTWVGGMHARWPHDGVGEFGYNVHTDFWGRGFASEAAKKLVAWFFSAGAHRVQATCWVKNVRSAKVLRNAGLKREGILKGYLKRGTEVRDEYMFGLARRDRR